MEKSAALQVDHVSFAYENERVLKNVGFSLRHGEFMALIGPNGSGKTTLLKVILGMLSPQEGGVWLDGNPVLAYPPKERARRMAYVSQQPFLAFPLTVEELVSLGRYPYAPRFGRGAGEAKAIEDALRLTDSFSLRGRKFTTLSGGERQKVLISRALAQTLHLLLFDEPTVHLDLYFQLQILETLKRLCTEEGATVVAVLHDPNQVSLFADKVLLLRSGEATAFGSVEEVMNEGRMRSAFGVEVSAIRDAKSEAIYFIPRRPQS